MVGKPEIIKPEIANKAIPATLIIAVKVAVASIILFPEGTRARPHKGLKPFSNSCGLLSIKNKVPIIPICHNSGLYWKNKRFNKEKGEITMRIGPPLYGKDAKILTSDAYKWINKNFKEIN